MPKLPDNKNPLLKNNLYKDLKIDPFAGTDDIKASLKNFSVKSLPPDEQKKKLESLKEKLNILRNNSSSVRLNALVLDKVDFKTVENRLKHLPSIESEQVQLPKTDLSQVYIEGQCIEIAEEDFQPVNKIEDLEINLSSINLFLYKNNIERHIIFDL